MLGRYSLWLLNIARRLKWCSAGGVDGVGRVIDETTAGKQLQLEFCPTKNH